MDYVPTVTDTLKCETITGVSRVLLDCYHSTVILNNVGLPWSEKGKWIHQFETTAALWFVVDLSCYCQSNEVDINQLDQALTLFGSVVNTRWVCRTAIAVLLLDNGVFRRQIDMTPLKNYFPDFAGSRDYESAVEYIGDRFKSIATRTSVRHEYFHLVIETRSQLSALKASLSLGSNLRAAVVGALLRSCNI